MATTEVNSYETLEAAQMAVDTLLPSEEHPDCKYEIRQRSDHTYYLDNPWWYCPLCKELTHEKNFEKNICKPCAKRMDDRFNGVSDS